MAEATGAPRSLSILVVEDYADAATSLALLLEWAGYRVRIAADAAVAVRAVQDAPPDVLLLDIGLPGMDGYALAKNLRGMLAARPLLIAVTGYGREEDKQRSRDEGFDYHLLKPVEPELLLALLRRYAAGGVFVG